MVNLHACMIFEKSWSRTINAIYKLHAFRKSKLPAFCTHPDALNNCVLCKWYTFSISEVVQMSIILKCIGNVLAAIVCLLNSVSFFRYCVFVLSSGNILHDH